LCAGAAEHGPLLRPLQPHQAVERVQALGGQDHGGVLPPRGQGGFLKIIVCSGAASSRCGSGSGKQKLYVPPPPPAPFLTLDYCMELKFQK
jgi:hypothetical protein